MRISNKSIIKLCLAMLLLIGSIGHALADISNCRSGVVGSQIDISLAFNITSNTASIAPGTQLDYAQSNIYSLTCNITGTDDTRNSVYFKNTMPANIKTMLQDSGVDVFQEYALGGGTPVNISAPNTANLLLGSWSPNVPGGPTVSFGLRYRFTAKKGNNALKPFDTGVFLLGHHVNYLGTNIGMPVYLRIVGNLTLLCPTPAVNISATNGGSVNFGAISPQLMNSGSAISKSFNVNMAVPQDCQTGLNVSVRFDPNNNTILDNKYLDMNNGLQVLLKNSTGDVNYGDYYPVGEVLPSSPVTLPYTAILTKIPGSTITSGPFSKTIRVIVSY